MTLRRTPGRQSGERGQVLPLFAGGLVAILVMVGLVVDTGVAFRERRTSQNIADLAALAGTRVIANTYLDPGATITGPDVYAAINKSATVNECTSPCTWTATYVKPNGTGVTASLGSVVNSGLIPAGAQGVSVSTNRSPGTFFIRIIGQNSWNVTADATALTSQLSTPPHGILLPLGIFDADYQTGVVYQLTAGMSGPGNFGWISWTGGQSAVTLANSICHPDNPAFSFPAYFSGDTGEQNSIDVRNCIQGYIDSAATVYVPIWKQTNGRTGSNLQYEIVGVAAFVLTGYDQHAVEVSGRFVDFYSYPSVPAGFGGPPCSATVDPNCDERTNFIGLVK